MIDPTLNAEFYRKIAAGVNSSKASEMTENIVKKALDTVKEAAELGNFTCKLTEKDCPELFAPSNYRKQLWTKFKTEMQNRGFKVDWHDNPGEWDLLHVTISFADCAQE